jgi:hypothetical protein
VAPTERTSTPVPTSRASKRGMGVVAGLQAPRRRRRENAVFRRTPQQTAARLGVQAGAAMGAAGRDHPRWLPLGDLCQNPQTVDSCLAPASAERCLRVERRPFRDQLVEHRVAHADARYWADDGPSGAMTPPPADTGEPLHLRIHQERAIAGTRPELPTPPERDAETAVAKTQRRRGRRARRARPPEGGPWRPRRRATVLVRTPGKEAP